jgi:hypothetical protein
MKKILPKSNLQTYSVIILLIMLRFIFPGDVSFIQDEANFLKIALKANQAGEWFTLGFEGARGIKYGPVSIYYFRVLILLTENVLYISLLNTIFITTLTILTLSKVAKFSTYKIENLLLVAFTSPYLWFYSRMIWDNSLNIALIGLALSFYLEFYKSNRLKPLAFSLFLMNLSIQIHLMSICILIPVIFHMILRKREILYQSKKTLFFLFILNSAILSPYLSYLIPQYLNVVYKSTARPFKSFYLPMLGSRIFSTFDFSYFLGKKWQLTFPIESLRYIVVAINSITWLAYFLSIKTIVKSVKERRLGPLLELSLFIMLFQMVLYYTQGTYGHPHYYVISWLPHLILIVKGIESLKNKTVGYLYVSSSFCSLIIIAVHIHYNMGSRSHRYGPTLKNQIAVARKLADLRPKAIQLSSFHAKTYPTTLFFLRDLEKINHKEVTDISAKKVRVDYSFPLNSSNGGVRVYIDDDD